MTLSAPLLVALVLALCALAFTYATVALGILQLRALVRATPRPLEEPLFVVIPARNEPDIAACVRAVLADPHPALRVVVVDDRSTDDTRARAEEVARSDARVTVLALDDDPPLGVFGKPRALARGLEHARSLAAADGGAAQPTSALFLDADVVLGEGALGALVHAKSASGAVALSGVPRLELRTAAEQLLVPTLASLVTARYLPTRVHRASDPTAFLNGQLILVDLAALDDVGGWSAVADTVLEDVALAKKLKARGHALRLADLRALAVTRMYASLAEIVEGFGKNAVALLGARAGVHGLFGLLLALFPWTALALAAGEIAHVTATRTTSVVHITAITVAVTAATSAWMASAVARHLARLPRWPAFVLPVAYLGVAFVLVRASLRHARGAAITWKGRAYPR